MLKKILKISVSAVRFQTGHHLPYLDHSTNEIYKDYEVAKSEILASHLEFSSGLIDNEAIRSMPEEKNRRPFYETLSFNQIIDSWQAYQAKNRYH